MDRLIGAIPFSLFSPVNSCSSSGEILSAGEGFGILRLAA
jgi:hypothetical protein